MHIRPSIFTLLLILLVTGCAAVDPYPPVTREQEPTSTDETGLAVIEEQPAPAAGLLHRIIHIRSHYQPEEFWQQVRRDFRLSGTRNEAIDKRTAEYAQHAWQVERILRHGEPYLAYIRREVEIRGFPTEVVMLPFIESGFDPFAYSHGRAAGLWQFIPSTGRYYGLKQDWWYDERRDVVASTQAALDYLDKLQKEFKGDWLLAFAAYNAGGGTIRNAIKRNRKVGKPTDFWHLELRAETAGYVPKLLAISRIINKPRKYGIKLPPIDSQPAFAVVETGDQLDLVVAAELADTNTDAFYQLNPGFNRWATHPNGPHRLAIPVDKADTFKKKLAALPASERVKWVRHRIAKGETLSHIAQRYQTTVEVLKQSNNLGASRIRTGGHLLVPVAAKDVSRYAALNKRLQNTGASSRRIDYQVQNGDSLWAIARMHQVSVAQLKDWNQMDSGSLIKPGQQLVIWKGDLGTLTGKQVRTIIYTVRSGDSLYSISRKYNVTVANLQNWNDLRLDKHLQPGQNLKLHIDVTRLTKT